MIKKIVFCSLLFCCLGLLVLPAVSFGQEVILGGGLEMALNPEKPEPFESVKITLKSYREDLARAKITWFINGEEKGVGIGLDEFNIVTGKSGTKITIRAEVLPFGKEAIEISKSFSPSAVDLIYEALSYTPPFYKGKALNPNQGTVRVTAVPELIKSDGTKISPQNIVYVWKKDGNSQPSSSGLGKNTILFTGGIPIRDTSIEVSASSLDNTVSASKIIKITNESPKVVFYENSPIYGIMMNRTVRSSVNMLVDEFGVLAVPYFFSVDNMVSPNLNYVWSLGGQTIENQEQKNTLTTRQEKSGVGSALFNLKISNKIKIFQFQENGYTINFKKE